MRHLVIALGAFVVATLPASAQVSHGAQHPAPPPPPPRAATPPMVVAPPLTFPLPPLMPPVAGGLLPRVGEGVPFHTHSQRSGVFSSGAPYAFGYSAPEGPVATKPARPAAPATGLLRLSVTPASAQVFVDSYYVGTVDDINAQRALQLEAGPHRIEFRAPQYQTLTVDVRILPYETVTYRGALDLARPAMPAAPPVAAGPPTLLYVIPNCYLGNVPPRPGRLPAGCDITKVQILERR